MMASYSFWPCGYCGRWVEEVEWVEHEEEHLFEGSKEISTVDWDSIVDIQEERNG